MYFPSLHEFQVALLRSDPYTGHVLNDTLLVRNVANKEETIYTIFNSLIEAEIVVNKLRKEREIIELTLYNWREEVIWSTSHL